MTAILSRATQRFGRRGVVIGGAVLAIVLLALVPSMVSSFHVFVATRVLIFAIFAMALNLVFGFGGLPSLGHAAFFGIGGYTVAIGLARWGWEFWTIIAVAVLLGTVVGALMGLLTIRTQGIYLLLLTLAFAQSIWALAFEQVEFTAGDNGISGITRDGIPFGFGRDFYTFVLIIGVLLAVVMWLWVRSPAGRVLVGARESKSRMEALGCRVWPYRVGAFALSGAISAIAGVLLVYLQGIASPDLLDWTLSAEVLVICIIGGTRTLFGPAIGAGVVIVLQEVVSGYTERWNIVLGLLYILTMLVLREGLTGLAERLRSRRRRAPEGDEPEPPPNGDTDAAEPAPTKQAEARP
ncbi:branched-chain amino acid ABC transporter permease [Actinophytocola sp.]|uniref:branched-chain amino acid ABC transporter permease n=1 Tax=Actinophytocola sp. TaxID=1872138 RepID=UPI003D6A9A42